MDSARVHMTVDLQDAVASRAALSFHFHPPHFNPLEVAALAAEDQDDDVVGGISKNVKVVDKDHPLGVQDPALETLLINQAPKILGHYRRAKNVPKGSSSEDPIQFRPIQFTTQVVAGTNYYVKLAVIHENQNSHGHAEEYIHVRIFYQPWTETTQLTGIQVDKQLADGFDHDFEPLPEDAPASDVGQQEEVQSDQHILPRTMIR
ncbi:hypothetical protein BGZ70_004318 [Mortierella alpina]|uniref:Cystatin domain-containing protein n=1 Tax=Mortierella alpina TaxID=64518 RepID=A0A9P6JA66_MORAP|nr:hypothetical protein BGZ70_004318 [Mortierella alpina]